MKRCSIRNLCIFIGAVFQIIWLIIILSTIPNDTDSIQCSIATSQPTTKQIIDHSILTADTTTADMTSSSLSPKNNKTKCFLFVMILSSINGKSRRDAIRSTWMLDHIKLEPKVIIKFIIGTSSLGPDQSLYTEQEQYNDLLLLPELKESFNNLTRKVLSSFVHINKLFSYQYLLKGDDDSFIRLDVLLHELSLRPSHTKYYWGFFDGRSVPKKAGRYKESEWFVCDLYIPYALGGGYVLSNDLVSRMVVNSDGLQLYNSEDISVGLWLSGFDIERKHDVRFDTEYKSRGCHNDYLVSHKQSESDMIEKYTNIKRNGKQCTTEKQVRGSYHYNWKVPPSQCCKREKGIP